MDMLDNRTMQLSLELMRMDNLSGGRLLLANDQSIAPPNGTYWPTNPNTNHTNTRPNTWSGTLGVSYNTNQNLYRPASPQVPPSHIPYYTTIPQQQTGPFAYTPMTGYPMCAPPSLPATTSRGQSPASQATLSGSYLQGNISNSRVAFSSPSSPLPASNRQYNHLSAPPSVAPFYPSANTAPTFNPYNNINIPPMVNTSISALPDLESQLACIKRSPSPAPMPCIPELPPSPLEGKADSTVGVLDDCGAMTALPVFNDADKSPKSVKSHHSGDEKTSIPPATPVSIFLSPPSRAEAGRNYAHASPERIVDDLVDSFMSGDLSPLDSSIRSSSPNISTPPTVIHPTPIVNGMRGKRLNYTSVSPATTRQSGKSIAALKAQHSKVSRHSGPPYPCWYPNCGQSFARRNNIERHISDVHLHRTPYKCNWPGCKKAFSQKGNLNAHQRTHTGERPYVCSFPDCNMSFTAKSNLRTHERKHTGERPHVCAHPKCGKSFIRTTALRSHSLKAHGLAALDNGGSSSEAQFG